MAPNNEHLLDNFNACKETRTLAGQLLREAKVKTAAGSGYEIGALSTGLPAVCILIASERLNNGDVTKKAAQAAACLKPKDFSKVYTQVQAALETIATTTTPITQSPSLRVRRKKEPLRELPSKDSPKKRQAGDLQKRSSSDAMDIETPLPETPKKKRKNDFSPDPALLSTPTFSSISSSRTITIVTPVKRPKTSTSVSSSPLKRSMPVMNATLNLPSSSEENEVENLLHPRRFRPVYLDCKQWNARDPRLARIWKKTEMRKQVLIEQCGYPLDRYRPVEV